MDFAAEFLDQNRLFSELIAAGDPATPVPTCPGWTLKQLFRHVGGGNRWAGQIVSDRMQEALAFDAVRDARAPADPRAAIDWLDAGARILVAATAADPDIQVWTFTGPQPARWWVRRRLHEVVVHCADAAIAIGAPFDPYPALAADALQDLFLKAMGQGSRFCAIRDPRAWLFEVARHHLVDLQRKHREWVSLPDDLHHEAPTSAVVDDLTGCLPRVLSELDEADRLILSCCDINGMTQQAFATAQGLTLAAAKSRLQRARVRLKEGFGEQWNQKPT